VRLDHLLSRELEPGSCKSAFWFDPRSKGTERVVLGSSSLVSTLQWLGYPLRSVREQLNKEDSSILLSTRQHELKQRTTKEQVEQTSYTEYEVDA
jgi:hypothetical protein